MALRVVIQQPALPKYRVPAFRELAGRPGIDLLVVYGDVPNLTNVEPDGFAGLHVPFRDVSVGGRRLSWHGPQWSYASRDRADVVIFTWNANIVSLVPGLLRARRNGVGTILWGHGYSHHESNVRRRVRNGIARLADGLLFYNDRVARVFRDEGWDAGRLHVARNALDQTAITAARAHWQERPAELESFKRSIAPGGPTLLFVSRLLPENRVDLLLAAAARLIAKFPTLSVVIVGKGEDSPLRAQAAALGIADRVTFAGPVYDEQLLAAHFLAADVFVYPAFAGLSIMHAFGYGLPVVVSEAVETQGPERDAVVPGVNGLTYRDGDVDDLTRQIDALLSDPTRCRAMGEAALETIRRDYSISRMVDGFEAAIRAVAPKH